MVSQCTKYEVSRFTRYDAMNGGAKCRKRGGLGRLGALQATSPLDRAYTTSYSTYDSVLYRFRDTAGYLSKVAEFDPPHLHLAPT